MTRKTLPLTDALYDYLLKKSVHEPDVLQQLRQVTLELPMAKMQISPEQGQLLQFLIHLTGAKRIVEVGTFTGYSSLAMALALPDDGQLITCDVNQESTDVAKQYWQQAGVSDQIDLYLAPALDTLNQLMGDQAGQFDIVFIDADKENYIAYYECALQLLRPGGLIAIDNVLWDGKVIDEQDTRSSTESIRELNQTVYDDQRVIMTMLPIGDGMTLAMKRKN